MKKLNEVFQDLGLDSTNGLYCTKGANWETDLQLPSRVKRCLGQINPDAFFCFDNKPLILFFENPTDKDLHKKIWNINEVPVIITITNGSVEIFNGFNLLADNTLETLCSNDKLTDFSYFQLVTGKTWETYEKELSYKNRVDYKLLNNIGATREQILKQFPPTDENDEETKKRYVKITNALLGKIIFVRYLIDRKVILNFEGQSKKLTNLEFCELLRNPQQTEIFFNYLADTEIGFNGDLFPITEEEYKIIPQNAYKTLIDLLTGQEIATGQQSLFELYDFSIIPVEFISNVYESFVGIEKKKNKKSKENDYGVHYTPLFLVDYILSETVEKFINQEESYHCKVLDPSCGSGVFLVETLRKLIEQYIKQNREIFEQDKEKFKEEIKNIAKANIFGIDKDESAVQVAIFSIYLTLLSEMEPREIDNFKFPPLLNTNFFCADFFDETKEFNTVFTQDNFKFDFIVGNPPWFRGQNEKKKTKQEPLYVQYIENQKKQEKGVEHVIDISNKEIAQAFLFRSSDFCTENTKCALIVTSKVLYNLQGKNFRKYFLNNYLIERVFELAPVRREVFDKSNDKAIAPACVLFFSHAKGKNTDTNPIEHITLKPSRFFSMFKIFSIYRHDIQTVQQDRLKKDDWLWKVLVYGSYLDFNFIKRLKEDYQTIQETIERYGNFKKGQGITVEGGDLNDVSDLVGKPYINTKSDIQKFWINPNTKEWKKNIVHRVRDKELYKVPVLLIKKGFPNDFSLVSAISYKDAVYTDSLTGIRSTNNNIDLLRQFEGFINSSLVAYYNLSTFSSSGIEREVAYSEEILSLPYADILPQVVKEIEALQENYHNQTFFNSENTLEKKIEDLMKQIYDVFSITQEEQDLIDYANNVIIPLQMKHKGHEKLLLPCKNNDKILGDYANLFIDRFASNFEKNGKKFIVEIWHTTQIVGMFFKVISQSEYTKQIVWKDKQKKSNDLFQKIIQLGKTKITDKLFIQKDIRGFEKDYFYVFKPNEKRLWHKAVGYLDVYEFLDAILKSGRDGK